MNRFRPEFAKAFGAWFATKPLTNESAPKTPFAMPDYQVVARADADRLDRAAEASAVEVSRNIQRASNYVLTVVLYSVVLFFAGMSTKIASRRVRTFMLVAACIVLLTAIAWLFTFPVSLQI